MLERLIRLRTKRVRLNLLALEKALAGQKKMAVASAIASGGSASIAPSTLTRYLSGERSPSIAQAVQIAQAVDLDPVEIILGYADDKRSKATTWLDEFAEKSRLPLGIDLRRFIGKSGHYLKFLHLDCVVPGGPHRFAFRTLDGEVGFASVPVHVDPADLPTTLRFLYRSPFIPGLPLINEIGEIRVTADAVHSVELWTLREETRARPDPDAAFRIRFWQDGDATAFYLISDKAFETPAAKVVAVDEQRPDEPTVTYHPTGFHKHSPSPTTSQKHA